MKRLVLIVLGFILLSGCSFSSQVGSQGNTALPETETTEEAQLPPREIRDLTEAYEIILKEATREFLAGYPVDDTFLMWLTAEYGEEDLLKIAYAVIDGELTADAWYEVTGNSIHVLWLSYCQIMGLEKDMLENVIYTTCANEEEIVISFTGDFNFAEDWYTMERYAEAEHGISDCITSGLLEEMKNSDILFMNNEFVYSDATEALEGKAYTFRADEERVKLLKELGADIVSLGNNHTFDYGAEGILDTMNVLEEAGIAYIGAGEDLDAAKKIVYYVANGKKIAFVAATQIERTLDYTKEATDTTPGVLKCLHPQKFIEVIQEARKYSDYVIAVPHWGTEGSLYPDSSQTRLASQFEAAGADVIIGGHPHRMQGATFINDTPVAYSLGNFWFSTGTLYTTLTQVVIDEEGGLWLRYLPCLQKDLTTELITDKTEKDEFYHYLAAISTNIGIDEEGNVYDIRETEDVFPYNSTDSRTTVRGNRDNEGIYIDIVGNRKE